MPKQLTIKQLLLLAFLLAGLLPAMLVSFLSFFQAREALKKEITHDMLTLSQAVANDIARMMYERVQNVHSWSRLSIMQEAKIGDVDKRLSVFLKELNTSYGNIYRNIYVIDTQNNVVASSNSTLLSKTINERPNWFNIAQSNSKVNVGQLSENTLPLSAAILDANGDIEPFTLVAEFNWQNIESILNSSAKQQTAAVLFNKQGTPIAKTPNWEGIEGGHSLRISSQALFDPLALNWKVGIEKLHSVAVAPADRLGWIFLALLVTSILFSAILVIPIARTLTLPLSQLTNSVLGFAKQKKLRLPHSGPTEVRTLSNAFASMAKDLAQYEADLTRAAKLAVAGEMAAAMSHEIRTPLGILRSSAELLQREKHLSKEATEVLGFIISETERLNKLVSTLIDAARPRQPNYAEHDLNHIINHCIALLSTQAQAKNIHIHYAVNRPVMVELDADQITQVLMNLLMNAIQILPREAVEQGNIEITLTETTQEVTLQIADDGPGIPRENQASIFEPFFTQRVNGIGLGLAIVKQIVQTHHGEIHYENSAMQGAQFTITIPKKRT
jgi:two-component system sensor histidine kinase HydH